MIFCTACSCLGPKSRIFGFLPGIVIDTIEERVESFCFLDAMSVSLAWNWRESRPVSCGRQDNRDTLL
eukprot:snap_masked-scaffold_42-processed-gene-0.33-mRNA-1 protein AED:1.00 eAED:1.00 QI:0/0/0/0/1/1/2/0/67